MIDIKILGQKWKVFLFDEDRYIRRLGDDSSGLTNTTTKEIYFNQEELHRDVVIHELTHALKAETCTESANLTADQVEEMFCDLVAKHGDYIIRLGRKLFKELKNGDLD